MREFESNTFFLIKYFYHTVVFFFDRIMVEKAGWFQTREGQIKLLFFVIYCYSSTKPKLIIFIYLFEKHVTCNGTLPFYMFSEKMGK